MKLILKVISLIPLYFILVIFNNGQRLLLNVSYTIFHNQILRCSRLMVVYSTR